jgi:hypothetical protein
MITVAMTGQPVLELTGVGKDFGAIRAPQGVRHAGVHAPR